MERIQVAPNFYLDEFVDPYTYFNCDDHGLSKLDKCLFDLAQLLRYLHGKPITINNWWSFYIEKKDKWPLDHIINRIEQSKTLYKWSGLRTDRSPYGGPLSAHRVGKAIDPKGNEVELYNIVKKNAEAFYKLGLRRLEDFTITPGWLHKDTLERNTRPNSIRVVDKVRCTRTIKF